MSFHLSRNTQRRMMIPIIYCFWCTMYTNIYLISAYAKGMGASLSMVGMITGAYGLAQFFLRLPIGILSDYYGSRKLFLMLGMACFMLSGLGFFLAAAPIVLLLCNFLTGVGASTWSIFMSSYCSYFPPEKLSHKIGSLTVMMGLGQLLGTASGGLFSMLLDVRHTFLVATVPAVLGLILIFSLDETHPGRNRTLQLRDFLDTIVQDRVLLLYSGLAAVAMYLQYSAVNSFAPLIITGLGGSSLHISIGSALCLLSISLLSALSCSFLKERFGVRRTCVGSFLLLGVSLYFIPFAKSLYVVFLCEACIGISRGAMHPLLNANATAHLSPSMHSTGNASFQAIYALGMFSGPAVSGLISEAFSLQAAFLSLTIIAIATAVLAGRNKNI